MNLKDYPKRKRQIVLNYILPRNIDWSTLNPTETQILQMRWGLGEYKMRHNHREISNVMGLTIAVISKMERDIIKKIRNTHEPR